jgi:uncharacterized NAD-dependent epimerase/dehydratase family protein
LIEIKAPYVLFLGDVPDVSFAKTAFGIVEWRPEHCCGQIRLPGNNLRVDLPDVTVEEAVAKGARTLIIGVANVGGYIAPQWLPVLKAALAAGLDLAAGLHNKLSDVPELAALAKQHGRLIHDIRQPRTGFPVGTGLKRSGKRVLAVGTDCAVGKKYAALALAKELSNRGVPNDFRATGQTGIFIAGQGVAVDAVISDFIAGAAETISPANDPNHWDVIEGQGSLFHPGYAGVALGLLHGSQPDGLVLCHEVGRKTIEGKPTFPVPSLELCAEMNLASARLTNHNVKLVGVSLNTSSLSEDEARAYMADVEKRMGVPATDPIRFGMQNIADYLLAECAAD